MEDCSHGVTTFDRRLCANVCLGCHAAAYEIYETWCADCAAWQQLLIYVGPNTVACGRCQRTLVADAPRRKEIRWSR